MEQGRRERENDGRRGRKERKLGTIKCNLLSGPGEEREKERRREKKKRKRKYTEEEKKNKRFKLGRLYLEAEGICRR